MTCYFVILQVYHFIKFSNVKHYEKLQLYDLTIENLKMKHLSSRHVTKNIGHYDIAREFRCESKEAALHILVHQMGSTSEICHMELKCVLIRIYALPRL